MQDIVSHPQPNSRQHNLSDYVVKRMVLSPPNWRLYNLQIALNWRTVKFVVSNASTIPQTGGVYTFLIQPGIARHPECSHLVYVGKTDNFRARYRNYLREKRAGDQSTRPHVTDMLNKWDGFVWFCFAPIVETDEIVPTEDALLAAYLPPTNKDFPATVSFDVRRLFGT